VKKIFSILFALVLVVSLVLVMTAPVLADITPGWTDITQVAAGHRHTVGLKSDGTVVAVGATNEWQCDVGDWSEIDQIAAGGYHTVGLRSDGTVVAAGTTYDGKCDVGDWSEIDQIAAGGWHTVGLESDGTVVAVGVNGAGQCDVSGWTNIKEIAAGGLHTVGLEEDGTVAAEGDNYDGQCDVGNWTDINHVAAGVDHTVGLKYDGTVVAVGNNDYGQCDIGEWTDITKVAAGETHTVGLTSDGTVVATGDNEYGQCDVDDWRDINNVAAGYYHTVGVRSDGIVIAVGNNDFGQCGEGVIRTIDGEDTVNAIAEADVEVLVNGTATVIVFKYEDNPHPEEPLSEGEGELASLGCLADGDCPIMKWVDVKVVETNSATEVEIRLYYTAEDLDKAEVDIDEGTLRIRWWDGSEWVQCSPSAGDSGVEIFPTPQSINNTEYLGYMWATVNQGTIPSLPLPGDEFGGYGHPSATNGGCGGETLADVTPFALVLVGIVSVWATKRRGKVS